jgi:uncharacterized membrane protein
MNKHRFWLPVIILIAFTLRLFLLGEQSLWYDEGVSWLLIQKSVPDLIQWTAADIQPPLYYLILWFTTRLFGDSEFALRFPSTLFNILTLPVLYLLAHRLFVTNQFRWYASSLAVTLFALSPLMVYYSQETRMYTLLVLEATLASYLLVRIIHTQQPGASAKNPSFRPQSSALLYALTATAALYTHYFAAFLLVAHALYTLIVLGQQRWPKTQLIRLLYAFGLTVLLFAPWLATLISRLNDDPSYWPGALKLNEALRKVIISFTSGETMFEQIGWWLALGYGIIFILALIARLINKKNQAFNTHHSLFTIHNSLFLLLWLFIPIALILLFSYQSPKFNPRYTLLSYPAFILLLTLALSQLRNAPLTPRITHYALRFIFYISLVFVLTTYAFSLYNWYTVIDFSKDDFKALAQFVRERQAPNETVLLSSGHMFPVWAYYYGQDNWTPLPEMERLDVNRVTGLSITRDIAPAIEGKDGVWLVTWQDEVIDPNGVVPFWLDRIGQRPGDAGDFWGIGLEHWRFDPARATLLQENAIKQPTAHNFANQVDLLGMTQLNNTEIALFWQARQSLSDDLLVTINLTDEAGLKWNEETTVARPGAYFYPPPRWPVGEIVLTRHTLPWESGSPPGEYIAEVGLGEFDPANNAFTGWDILDEQGHPQRRTALLKPITLDQAIQPDTEFATGKTPFINLSPVVTLQHRSLSPPDAEPGDEVLLKLLWQTDIESPAKLHMALEITDTGGNTYPVNESSFSLPRQPYQLVLGQYRLDIPAEAAPGPATVQLRLVDQRQIFPIGQLNILPTERNFTVPESVNMAINTDFSEHATLLGVDCTDWNGSVCQVSPNQPVTLTFYWQANGPFDTNYTIFTHLLSPDETVLINADHAPPKPTQAWVPGEIIADSVTLTLPADLPSGAYPLEVGLYDAADPAFQRLPATNGDTRVLLPGLLLAP